MQGRLESWSRKPNKRIWAPLTWATNGTFRIRIKQVVSRTTMQPKMQIQGKMMKTKKTWVLWGMKVKLLIMSLYNINNSSNTDTIILKNTSKLTTIESRVSQRTIWPRLRMSTFRSDFTSKNRTGQAMPARTQSREEQISITQARWVTRIKAM